MSLHIPRKLSAILRKAEVEREEMAKGSWVVQSNYISGIGKMYIAARVLNADEPVHSGNIEYHGGYSANQEEIQELVDELNKTAIN